MNKKSGRGPSRRKKESEKKKSGTSPNRVDQNYSQEEEIRINKFIAHAGLCSRK